MIDKERLIVKRYILPLSQVFSILQRKLAIALVARRLQQPQSFCEFLQTSSMQNTCQMIVQHQNVGKVKLAPFEICYLHALHISQFHDTCKYLLISCHLLYKLATPVATCQQQKQSQGFWCNWFHLTKYRNLQQETACGIYIYLKWSEVARGHQTVSRPMWLRL